jgi:hypothetical protein
LDIIISAYPKLMIVNSGNPALEDWFWLHAQSRAQKKNTVCKCYKQQMWLQIRTNLNSLQSFFCSRSGGGTLSTKRQSIIVIRCRNT